MGLRTLLKEMAIRPVGPTDLALGSACGCKPRTGQLLTLVGPPTLALGSAYGRTPKMGLCSLLKKAP